MRLKVGQGLFQKKSFSENCNDQFDQLITALQSSEKLKKPLKIHYAYSKKSHISITFVQRRTLEEKIADTELTMNLAQPLLKDVRLYKFNGCRSFQ